jgi:hypothetical protein
MRTQTGHFQMPSGSTFNAETRQCVRSCSRWRRRAGGERSRRVGSLFPFLLFVSAPLPGPVSPPYPLSLPPSLSCLSLLSRPSALFPLLSLPTFWPLSSLSFRPSLLCSQSLDLCACSPLSPLEFFDTLCYGVLASSVLLVLACFVNPQRERERGRVVRGEGVRSSAGSIERLYL